MPPHLIQCQEHKAIDGCVDKFFELKISSDTAKCKKRYWWMAAELLWEVEVDQMHINFNIYMQMFLYCDHNNQKFNSRFAFMIAVGWHFSLPKVFTDTNTTPCSRARVWFLTTPAVSGGQNTRPLGWIENNQETPVRGMPHNHLVVFTHEIRDIKNI